jgi:hypothetical protein
MTSEDIFKAFFTQDNFNINYYDFSIDLLLTFFTSLFIAFLFNKFSKTLSNRQNFSKIFVLLAITTMMVISIIKSSIALSLGLVGALSIIRFRTAIKDPEELVYIFLIMGIGLGFGSGNRLLTLIYFCAISVIIVIKSLLNSKQIAESPMFLFINFNKEVDNKLVIETLTKYTSFSELNRLQIENDSSNYIFNVKFKRIADINNITDSLKKLDPQVTVTYTENKGLFI